MDETIVQTLVHYLQGSWVLSSTLRAELGADLQETFRALLLPAEEDALAAARALSMRLLPAIERDRPARSESSQQSALASFVLYGVGSRIFTLPSDQLEANSTVGACVGVCAKVVLKALARLLSYGFCHLELRSMASAALWCGVEFLETVLTSSLLQFDICDIDAVTAQFMGFASAATLNELRKLSDGTPALDASATWLEAFVAEVQNMEGGLAASGPGAGCPKAPLPPLAASSWHCDVLAGICELTSVVLLWLSSAGYKVAVEGQNAMLLHQGLEALTNGASPQQLQFLVLLERLYSLPARLMRLAPSGMATAEVLQQLGGLPVVQSFLAALGALPRYAFLDSTASGEQVREGEEGKEHSALAVSQEDAATTLRLVLQNLHLLLENGFQVGAFIEGGGVQLLGSILGRRNALNMCCKAAFQSTLLAAECMALVLDAGHAQASKEFYNGGCCRQVLNLIGKIRLTKLCTGYEFMGDAGLMYFSMECSLLRSLEFYLKVPTPHIDDFVRSDGVETLMALLEWDPEDTWQFDFPAVVSGLKRRITELALSVVARVCVERQGQQQLRGAFSLADLSEFLSRAYEGRSGSRGVVEDMPAILKEELQFVPLHPLESSVVLCASQLLSESRPDRESFMARGPSGPGPLLRHFLATARWQPRGPDTDCAKHIAKAEALIALGCLCCEDPDWRRWLLKEQRLHEALASTMLHYLPKMKQLAADAIKEGCAEANQLGERAGLYSGSPAQGSNTLEGQAAFDLFLIPVLPVSNAARVLFSLPWLGKDGKDAVMEVLADGKLKAAASVMPLLEREPRELLDQLFAWGDQQLAEAQRAADEAAALLLAEEEDAQQRASAKVTKRQRQKAAKRAQAQQQQQEQQQAQVAEEEPTPQGSSPLTTMHYCNRGETVGNQQLESCIPSSTDQAAISGAHESASHAAAGQAGAAEQTPLPLQERPGRNSQQAAAAGGAASQPPRKGKKKKCHKGGQAEQRSGGEAAYEQGQQGGEESQHSLPAAALVSRGCSSEMSSSAGSMFLAEGHQSSAPAAQATGEASAAASACSLPDEQELEFQALLSQILPGYMDTWQPLAAAVADPASAAEPHAPPPACTSSSRAPSGGSEAVPGQLQGPRSIGLAQQQALAAVLSCPLTGELLRDPVVAGDGHTYERWAVEAWVQGGSAVSPVTGLPLGAGAVRPNYAVRELVRGLGSR